jgi:probable F420-dependent oxidoreductase
MAGKFAVTAARYIRVESFHCWAVTSPAKLAAMHIGFGLPQYGNMANHTEQITEFAVGVEKLGAASLWVGDRALAPTSPTLGFARTGPGPFPTQLRVVFDPFVALTLAAAHTSRVRLGSSVLNAPWYSPLLLARSLTAIDHVSRGRLIAGLGLGWSPDEFGAVGVPFEDRGARLDEFLDVLDAIWLGDPVEHEGDRWRIPASHIDLRPVQHPRPPLYLGGTAPAALARIGARADGWLPSVMVPGAAGVDELRRRWDVVRDHAVRAGRAPDAVDAVVRVDVRSGTPLDAIGDVLGAIERAGFDHAFVELIGLARDAAEAVDIAAELLTVAAPIS